PIGTARGVNPFASQWTRINRQFPMARIGFLNFLLAPKTGCNPPYQQETVKRFKIGLSAVILLILAELLVGTLFTAQAKIWQESNSQALTVQAGFTDKQSVAPDEAIELTLNRPLTQGEGRLAVVIGSSDLTDLFAISARSLKYVVRTFPLPVGE